MRAALISAALLVAGLVHLLPASGLLGSEALARLYGLRIEEPNLLLLACTPAGLHPALQRVFWIDAALFALLLLAAAAELQALRTTR